jgi:hypothetical protein
MDKQDFQILEELAETLGQLKQRLGGNPSAATCPRHGDSEWM